jgi:hypothetical protein
MAVGLAVCSRWDQPPRRPVRDDRGQAADGAVLRRSSDVQLVRVDTEMLIGDLPAPDLAGRGRRA